MQDKNAAAKRAFLRDSKGLTDEEIDEAVQRAAKQGPSPPQNVYATANTPQPVPAPQAGPQAVPVSNQLVPSGQPEAPPMRWSQILLAVSVVGAAAYGVTTLVSPVIRRWWQGPQEDSQAAAQASALDRLMEAVSALTQKQAAVTTENEAVAATVKKLQV